MGGKNASVDGTVMASHSDDGDGNPDPRYVLVPAVQNIKDKLRPVYPDIEIWKR